MKGKWLSEKLYSIDEKVRVEKGPQLIELICNDENLKDAVTFAHYQIGKIDALGGVIMPERVTDGPALHRLGDVICEGETMSYVDWRANHESEKMSCVNWRAIHEGDKMTCVDWRDIHVPHIWKIYELQDGLFIKVDETEDKDDALKRAQKLFGEM